MSDTTQNNEAQFYSDLLRAFFDSANDAIFVLCDEMKFLICNKTTQQWLGQSEDVLTQHRERIPITEFLGNQESVDLFKSSFEQALNKNDVLFETYINPNNGKQRWVEINMKRVDVDAGDMVISVARDITERKQAEVEKDRLQRELSQAQKMDILGQLTGGIAHDFNNILGIISGYTELAINQYEAQQQPISPKYLDSIYQATERAKKLIAQLMVFSRRDNPESRPVQLTSLIKEDIKMLHATLPSSIELNLSYEENIPYVLMESIKLHQLLLNLCINSKDAMHGAGKIDITLGLKQIDEGICASCHKPVQGEWVELTIKDNGSGIENNVIPHIFDPFFTTKTVGKGTGMGLAVVSRIVESHNGHIIVKSELGTGTHIHLLFPTAVNPVSKVPQDTGTHINNKFDGHGESILIVDDEPDLVDFLSHMLSMHGYNCTGKSSSAEALKLFQSQPDAFDLIITDQTMPELTGSELITKIRKIKPEQAAVLVTGYSEIMDNGTAEKMGIEFIQKPVTSKQILKIIGSLIANN